MKYSVFTPVLIFWIQNDGQMFLLKTRMNSLWMIALAVVCLSPPSAAAQTKLRWKFKKGESLNYTMTQSMNFMGQDIQTKMKLVIEMSWTVGELASNGSAKMKQKFTRIKFKMTLPPPVNQTIEYDSKDGKAPGGLLGKILGGTFAALVGAETRLTIDPQGNISDYKFPEEVLKKLKQNPGVASMGGAFSKRVSNKWHLRDFSHFP
jgi:hypothetical protein